MLQRGWKAGAHCDGGRTEHARLTQSLTVRVALLWLARYALL